jgi:hypothetical protein
VRPGLSACVCVCVSETVKMCSEATAHERYWLQEVKSLQASYRGIVAQYPDAVDVLQQVYRVLGDLVSLAGCTPK